MAENFEHVFSIEAGDEDLKWFDEASQITAMRLHLSEDEKEDIVMETIHESGTAKVESDPKKKVFKITFVGKRKLSPIHGIDVNLECEQLKAKCVDFELRENTEDEYERLRCAETIADLMDDIPDNITKTPPHSIPICPPPLKKRRTVPLFGFSTDDDFGLYVYHLPSDLFDSDDE
jgi:hypothetical protein